MNDHDYVIDTNIGVKVFAEDRHWSCSIHGKSCRMYTMNAGKKKVRAFGSYKNNQWYIDLAK